MNAPRRTLHSIHWALIARAESLETQDLTLSNFHNSELQTTAGYEPQGLSRSISHSGWLFNSRHQGSQNTGTLHYLIRRILITDVRVKLLSSAAQQEAPGYAH